MKLALLGILTSMGISLTLIFGWIMNIIAICHHAAGIDGMLVARIIGVFMAPLGAILGFIN